ncbi:glycosyltransferase family 39 protein [Streptomyces mirabilis]|uniref:glycosyltransferase family 39 protein n=1 Tax=Streptomyces mirabilis TaxID=68239 RepID=UPI0036DE7870
MEFEISTIREQAPQPAKAALFSSGLTRFRTKAFVAIVPMTVTVTLGLWGIRRQNSMWGDESVTYQLAHRDLTQIWGTAQYVDLVHAFYYAIMHEIYGLAGGGLLTLRLPSVLAMSAAAAGVGLLGLRLAGPRAGLLAGLVFPLVPQIQQYTQEGRSYAMVCALVTCATYALVACAVRHTRWRWTAYGSTMLLACLLHEFAVFALAAHGITLLVSGVPRPALRAWSVTVACIVAGLLPLAIRSSGESGQVSWIAWPDPVQFLGFLAMVTVGMRCARRPMNVRGGDTTAGPGPADPRTPRPPAAPSLTGQASFCRPIRSLQQYRIRAAAGCRDRSFPETAAVFSDFVGRSPCGAGRAPPAEPLPADAPKPTR